MRVLAAWLVLAFAAGAFMVVPTTGCTDGVSECTLSRECDVCVRAEACAWCLETGQCLAAVAQCPGDRAITLEQCESAH